MTEEPTRALPLDPETPTHGRVGPADPHADPETHPGMVLPHSGDPATDPGMKPVRVDQVAADAPTVPVAHEDRPALSRTRTGGLYAGLILSALVLVFLLVFILQNLDPVQIYFLGFSGGLPVGVAMLFSAIAGLLLVAIPGGLRIMQLRRAARRAARR